MKPIHATLALALATGFAFSAQAGEKTDFPVEASTASRAAVQAEARSARTMPGELYDGSSTRTPSPMAAPRTREEVRAEAIVALSQRQAGGLRRNEDLVGGM